MWFHAAVALSIIVMVVMNICILISLHRKTVDIINVQNCSTKYKDPTSNCRFSKETNPSWISGVLNFFPELQDVALEDLQPLDLSPMNSERKKLVIAIPVVGRTKYTSGTLASLFDKLDEQYRNDVVFLLMIASNKTLAKHFGNDEIASSYRNFSDEIESGLLKVIAVPKAWYTIDIRSVPSTFGDSSDRMYWRTKQNIDYLYMMTFASQMADYYLQLEDDVVAADGYMRVIFNYLTLKRGTPWFVMSFTRMGFIGKLFRCRDLKYLSNAIAMYYQFKPVDWILFDVLQSRYCDPGKSATDCAERMLRHDISSGTSQFQHVGTISSLPGKIQKIHDHTFGKGAAKGKRHNPAASVVSSMSARKNHDGQYGYDNYYVMWFANASAGDHVSIKFNKEITLTGVMFMTGLPPVPQCKLGPEAIVYAFTTTNRTVHLGQFSSSGDFLHRLEGTPVTELRIEITDSITHQIIIDHIVIDTEPASNSIHSL